MRLFIPERPAHPSLRHMGSPARPSIEDVVTARPGDTLWTIAADHLGSDATDWEIAQEWPLWHRHNLDRIGPEPGELRPGTILRSPPRHGFGAESVPRASAPRQQTRSN